VTKRAYTAMLICILAALLAFGGVPALAQGNRTVANEPLYFPETGHYIRGDFLKTYLNTPNAQTIYGYPITEAFQEQTQGRIVQYFQRARFELFPEDPAELRVHISPLGVYLYTPGEPLPLPENFPACRTFNNLDSQYRVCYAFLEFFEANGGAAQFGYPISDFEINDGRISQYFQRAAFEWHPENPPNQRVELADLGVAYFKLIGEDPVRLNPAPPPASRNNIPQTVLDIQARAFPISAVLSLSGEQTIYVIVLDQNLQPVPGARTSLSVVLPCSEAQLMQDSQTTDKNGISKLSFSYRDSKPGPAKVIVTVSYNNLTTTTVTSFRVWW
jgi:hypothetical protein